MIVVIWSKDMIKHQRRDEIDFGIFATRFHWRSLC